MVALENKTLDSQLVSFIDNKARRLKALIEIGEPNIEQEMEVDIHYIILKAHDKGHKSRNYIGYYIERLK